MICAQNASLTYADGTTALKPFNLSLEKGDAVFITGPSGSGKTSLLKLMLGIEYPTQGEFSVMGQRMAPQHGGAIRKLRQHMGPVFQEFRLMPGRTVLDNVLLGMRFIGIPPHVMEALAQDSIRQVGLEHKINHTVDRLSWGECQRVAIARAVARKPQLIIADEPTGNLDQENASAILGLLLSFRSPETCVIITTHATHLLDKSHGGVFIALDSGAITCVRGTAHG